MGNGNGAMVGDCGPATRESPVYTVQRTFTVFFGQLVTITPVPAPLQNFVIPRMTQILPANPRRVELYLRSQFAGLLLTTKGNGESVSIQEVMGNDPNSGGNFELHLGTARTMYLQSAWYAVEITPAPAPDDQIAVYGIETSEI